MGIMRFSTHKLIFAFATEGLSSDKITMCNVGLLAFSLYTFARTTHSCGDLGLAHASQIYQNERNVADQYNAYWSKQLIDL